MVITNPMINPISIIINRFLERVVIEPTFSPMGVMDCSTPTLKSNIPTINRIAPTRKHIKMLGGIGAIVKQSNNTIAKIGNTAFRVSVNFSSNLDKLINKIYVFLSKYFYINYNIKVPKKE